MPLLRFLLLLLQALPILPLWNPIFEGAEVCFTFYLLLIAYRLLGQLLLEYLPFSPHNM